MNDSILNQQRLYLMTSPKSSYQDLLSNYQSGLTRIN